MRFHKFSGAVVLLVLIGCSQLGEVTARDASRAAALAGAVGDTVGEQCFANIAGVASQLAVSTDPGLLTGIEAELALQSALRAADCAPTFAAVLAELVKATPAAPLVP